MVSQMKWFSIFRSRDPIETKRIIVTERAARGRIKASFFSQKEEETTHFYAVSLLDLESVRQFGISHLGFVEGQMNVLW